MRNSTGKSLLPLQNEPSPAYERNSSIDRDITRIEKNMSDSEEEMSSFHKEMSMMQRDDSRIQEEMSEIQTEMSRIQKELNSNGGATLPLHNEALPAYESNSNLDAAQALEHPENTDTGTEHNRTANDLVIQVWEDSSVPAVEKRAGLTHETARDIAACLFFAQFLAWLALAMVPVAIDRFLISWGEQVIGDRPAAKIVATFYPLTAAIFTAALAVSGHAINGR